MKHSFISMLSVASLIGTFWFGGVPSFAQERTTEYLQTEADVAKNFGVKQFSPYVGRNYPTRPLWGDQHLHTDISVDAGTMCRLGQEDAYRFARGEEVTSTTGVRAKLACPLDWLVISDHAEMYGLMPQLLSGDRDLLANEQGRAWYDALKSGDKDKMFATAMEIVGGAIEDYNFVAATPKSVEQVEFNLRP